jgi:regulation of enolase protein 1 (concanavalin A-like superfamily)
MQVARNVDGSLWKNPLRFWKDKPTTKVHIIGAAITMQIPKKTDFWASSNLAICIDNGPTHWHKITGNFELMVKISGNFSENKDKAGLMIRLDDDTWAFCGMVFMNGRIYQSNICTRNKISDGSLALLPVGSENGLWFCFKRYQGTYESFYSFDCKVWNQTRQGILTERPVLSVGIAGGSPNGNGNLTVCFDYYRVKSV